LVRQRSAHWPIIIRDTGSLSFERRGQFSKSLAQRANVGSEFPLRFDGAGIGFDTFARQPESRHGRDRLHVESVEHLAQLSGTLAAAVTAISHDHGRLSRPFFVEMIQRVLQWRRIAPIVLRRDEHEGIAGGNLAAPGASVRERVIAAGRHGGFIVHRQRPILEVDDFQNAPHAAAAYLHHPLGDLWANSPRTQAADDDKDTPSVYHTRNMARPVADVKVQNTRNFDRLGRALVELISFLNSPQRDDALLREAKVSLDRALFPLLVRLGMQGPLGVAELADQVGRDHTTVSRQLAKLESLGLVERCEGEADRRRRAARLTRGGKKIVQAITLARRRLLSQALADWSEADRAVLASLLRRFADTLTEFARQYS
jgi:DNA-binding MarR family transcriptional regulator